MSELKEKERLEAVATTKRRLCPKDRGKRMTKCSSGQLRAGRAVKWRVSASRSVVCCCVQPRRRKKVWCAICDTGPTLPWGGKSHSSCIDKAVVSRATVHACNRHHSVAVTHIIYTHSEKVREIETHREGDIAMYRECVIVS